MTCRWPADDADGNAWLDFADVVSSALEEQGYCKIDLLEAPEPPAQAVARLSSYIEQAFQTPPPAFASAYLGADRSSEIASFDAVAIDDPFLSGCVGQLDAVAHLLEPWMLQKMGFEPDLPCSKMVFRRSGKTEDDAASQDICAAVDSKPKVVSNVKELSQTGAVEDFLQWAPRRRLCLFLFIDVSGVMTLQPKQREDGQEDIRLEPSPNTMLMLQHERFTYAYTPRPGDLVLQAWVLAQNPELMLQKVSGQGATRDDVMGMVAKVMPPVRCPLQITGAAVRGGAYTDMSHLWLALGNCLDMVLETPVTRWDWEVVLADVALPDDWGIAKHAGYCDTELLTAFDPDLFGVTSAEVRAWHPQTRLYSEAGYSCLVNAGWTRESLKGAPINTWSCDCGVDEEFHMLGEPWTPEAHQGSDRVMTASRLSIAFGLIGSVQSVDTACSASNVALNLAHQSLTNAAETGIGRQSALIFAGLAHTSPKVFMGLSMAHMLSSKGRSRTFDHSASGYCRSEGSNAGFARTMEDEGSNSAANDHVYGTAVSTACNQDGRSASLTAPNGPSQTACIKACMAQGGLGPDSVIKFECHGTGTALGDPIEVSSCRAVMKSRLLPLVQCSSKSNHGHMEAGAGLQGFLKTLMEISQCASMSNCHLRVLNHNMDVNGYPILHPIEITPLDGDGPESTCGVSSFGFGGTNSHSNFVGLPHLRMPIQSQVQDKVPQLEKLDYVTVQCPRCLGRKCWLCGIAVPKSAPQGKHRCASVREDGSSYELCSNCYDGKYVVKAPSYAEVRDPGLPVYVRGSWSDFSNLEEMLWMGSLASGHYEYTVTLGASRQERFQMIVDDELTSLIYPVQGDADQHVHIDGPDADGDSKFWLIDGVHDDAPAGAEYTIRFTWGRHRRRMEWNRVAA